jgi:DNA repair exonuclease SbcCD ATPase subunit
MPKTKIYSNINILENTNIDIKYIIHLADIHIRNDRQLEYEAVFETLYSNLRDKKLTNKNSVCCIIGDIFHSTQINAIAIQTCKNFLYKLSEITSIIVTYGNHDVGRNNASLNNLAAIIKTNFASSNKIFYIEENGIYLFNNILFGLTNTYSKEVFHIQNIPSMYKKIPKIGLYHGTITGAKTQSNYILNEPNLFKVGDFDSYNITLLGDIHKHQYMNQKKTIGYCGSLIQQNKGESIEKGYLLWDIKSNNSEFIKIYNNEGILKIKINSDGSYIIPQNLPKKLIIDIISESPNRLDIDAVYNELLNRKIHISERNEYLNINSPLNLSLDVSLDSPINPKQNFLSLLSNRDEIANLIRSQITTLNLLDQNTQTKLNEKISSLIDELSFKNTHIKHIKLLSLEFSDIMKYGSNNRIDFSKLNNIYGLCCENSSGKSTIIDTILFAIFGISTRGIPGDMINYQCKNMKTNIRLEVNGVLYEISRKVMRNSKGLETRQTKGEISIKENNIEIGLDIKKSLQLIEEKIGSYDDFIKNCIITQHSKVNFINFSPKDKVEYLCKISRIDIINNLSQLCSANLRNLKSDLTKKRKNLILYKSYSLEEDKILNIIQSKLQESILQKESLLEEFNLNQEQINTYNNQIALNNIQLQINNYNTKLNINTYLDNINLEELSIKLTKLLEEKDNIFAFITKTNYTSLKEEFDSQKYNSIKEVQNKIKSLSNNIFNDQSFKAESYNSLNIESELAQNNLILSELLIEKTNIQNDIIKLSKIVIKKIPKINIKLKKTYENALLMNETLSIENNVIKSELEIFKTDLDNLSSHEYDPKCKFCVKNNISKKKSNLTEMILKKNNNILINETIIKKNLLFIETKSKSYNKIKFNIESIENINIANSELAIKKDKIDFLQNRIDMINMSNINLDMILSRIKQENSNKIILKDINLLELELETIINSKLEIYEEYLRANTKLNLLSNEIISIKQIISNIESIQIASSIESCKELLSKLIINNNIIQSNIDSISKQIESYKLDLSTFNLLYNDILSLNDDLQIYQLIDNVVCNQEFTNKILSQHVLPQLELEINMLLKKFSDYTINIFFIKDSIFIYKNNGSNLVMNGGYESNLINIIFRICFTKLTGTVKTDFIIIDEFLDSSDEANKEKIMKVINYMQNIYKWSIVISHDVNIRENFSSNIIIKTVDSKQHIFI